jgi:hypothetical protein
MGSELDVDPFDVVDDPVEQGVVGVDEHVEGGAILLKQLFQVLQLVDEDPVLLPVGRQAGIGPGGHQALLLAEVGGHVFVEKTEKLVQLLLPPVLLAGLQQVAESGEKLPVLSVDHLVTHRQPLRP